MEWWSPGVLSRSLVSHFSNASSVQFFDLMANKAQIGWERRLEDGSKLEVYVIHTGGQYRFFAREKRYYEWQPVKEPPIEDWLELLDAVRRRITRRKLMPDDEERLVRAIKERFPEVEV